MKKSKKIAEHVNSLIVAAEFVREFEQAGNKERARIWRKEYLQAYTSLCDLGIPLCAEKLVRAELEHYQS